VIRGISGSQPFGGRPHYGYMGRTSPAARPLDDLEVAARCARGDRAAQRHLFDREVDRVHATLYRVLGPSRESEDLVQDVFLEVFRSIASYRGDARLATWISRVTAHVAYGHMAKKRPAAARLESVPEPESPEPPSDQQAAVRRAMRRVHELLGDLDPKVRLAFCLHVLDGQPLTEVAAAMRATLVATKSRVWRARRQLRRDPAVRAILGEEAEA
jgi:RNA polymerase sigma-70 factor, ECF subfamily